tara:strand:- start:1354 stop:1848 length:495 start_codon:yes stop_codon:yes gene_type:complete
MRDHREAYQIIEELLFREFRQGRARRRGGGHCCALLLNNYPRGNVLASIYSQVREGSFRRAARRGDVRFARRRACLCGVYDVKTRVGIFTSARGLTHCLGGVADALKSSTSNAGIETSWTTQTVYFGCSRAFPSRHQRVAHQTREHACDALAVGRAAPGFSYSE